jgi:hypothetical protein
MGRMSQDSSACPTRPTVDPSRCIMDGRFTAIEGKIEMIEGKIGTLDTRVSSLEDGQTLILADTSRIMREIGHPPNLATDDPGAGLAKVVYRMASVMLRGENAAAMPSIITMDVGEGEITKVQNREDLVARAKSAESALRALKEDKAAERKAQTMARRDRNKFWIAVIIAVVGSLAAILQAIGSLVRHEQSTAPAAATVHTTQTGEPR